ncbi:MAG: 50S rRNA methyltransferase [Puniceicoccaceae bacterium]|mgnify:FL=1|nr:50S rRNA methyltransferase [Puniceicoccaceae bacterium]|tara:strand:+ start:916 stop:1359 length:444 start_codon:yes stop_codon:yes gene_type:complete
MFHLTLLSVGKLKNSAIAELTHDYQKRIKRYGKFEALSISDGSVQSEGQRLKQLLDKRRSAQRFILAEEGQTLSSPQLAQKLDQLRGQPVVFVIGGAYGLDPSIKAQADLLLSLSPMTFTHELAQLLLSEQVYRAISILKGGKYHHE